jgi:hypothetical protein
MAGAVNNAKKKSPAMKLNDINIKERPEKKKKMENPFEVVRDFQEFHFFK